MKPCIAAATEKAVDSFHTPSQQGMYPVELQAACAWDGILTLPPIQVA